MQEKMTAVLKNLNGNIPEIIGGAVINIDGVIMASVMPRKIDEELIGGMASSLLGIGERISSELMNSDMDQLYINTPRGYVFVNVVADKASLIVLVADKAKLGLIFLEIKRAIQKLEQILT